ncbi:DUF2929 family protein [Bacillus niameyensis]|uniref:DUF2929 family protein n=1 Tax=Bacillus niameyensis TaxID=1522308 RepID=UPI0007807236|nr:DUF2929 family protein [Bacillus niameyensis]
MKLIMSVIWGFILSHVLSYVISSMTGAPYSFTTASLLSIGIIIFVYLIGMASITTQPSEEH